MIITKETDYALRVLRALDPQEKSTAETLAVSEQIPSAYIYKIIRKLSQGGYVQNLRGRTGGIVLGCDLHEVSLMDIITLMDGNANICACADEEYSCLWKEAHGVCSVNCKLRAVQQQLNEEFAAIKLDDLFLKNQKSAPARPAEDISKQKEAA